MAMKILLIFLPLILLNFVNFVYAADCKILCYLDPIICVKQSDCPADSYCLSYNNQCCKSPCGSEGFSQSCIHNIDKKHPMCVSPPEIRINACCSDDCLEGVDVSHHNGAIDWATAQQSVQVKFAMIKATQGEKFVDPNFVANWNGALQNGISPHAYHYFIGNCSVSMQLKNIQNTLQQVKFNLDSSILAIDVEPMYNRGINPKVMADNLWALMELLENAGFQNLFLYTNKEWNDIVQWQSYAFDRYPLWVASLLSDVYQRYLGLPREKLPNGFNQWKMWQYTHSAKVPGFAGLVDMNRGFCTK